MENHKEKKSYQCQYCFKAFARISTLKKHLWIHKKRKACSEENVPSNVVKLYSKIRPKPQKTFSCKQCGKSLHLTIPLYRVHTRDKPYQCQYCKKMLIGITAIYEHTLVTSHINVNTAVRCLPDLTFYNTILCVILEKSLTSANIVQRRMHYALV